MKSTEFVSAQNVRIEYEFASPIQRGVAGLVDSAVLIVYVLIMTFLISQFDKNYFMFMEFLIIKIPFLFYHPILEYLAQGQTLGKYAMGIRVVTLNGERPGLREIFTRWLFKGYFIWIAFSLRPIVWPNHPWEDTMAIGQMQMFIALHIVFGLVGFIYASIAARKQRMGDVMAGAVIIRNKSQVRYSLKDVLSIKNQENYTPEYPNVVRFTDEDMLLIKNTIQRVRAYPNPETKKFAIELANESARLIGLEETPEKRMKFLQTLLQDYVVLTR